MGFGLFIAALLIMGDMHDRDVPWWAWGAALLLFAVENVRWAHCEERWNKAAAEREACEALLRNAKKETKP